MRGRADRLRGRAFGQTHFACRYVGCRLLEAVDISLTECAGARSMCAGARLVPCVFNVAESVPSFWKLLCWLGPTVRARMWTVRPRISSLMTLGVICMPNVVDSLFV